MVHTSHNIQCVLWLAEGSRKLGGLKCSFSLAKKSGSHKKRYNLSKSANTHSNR